MIVNAEHFFKKVQKTLFKLGYIWVDDDPKVCSLKQAINGETKDYDVVYLDLDGDFFSLLLHKNEKDGVSISHNILKHMYVKK